MKILVGCDPEIFVKKDGQLVSAFGLVKGTKDDPFKVNRGAVQVDGMALEFNIDPASSEDEFYLNVSDVMNTLKSMCPDYELAAVPVAEFGLEYIEQQPEEAKLLGCDPDYDAWKAKANPRPKAETPFRTASGHVHIGWGQDFPTNSLEHHSLCQQIVKQMDYYLGLASLFYDADKKRRKLYGKAGAYRPKSYGVEYRTLSNAWLRSEDLIRWVYKQTKLGVEQFFAGNILSEKYGDISKIINTSNKKAAKEILDAEGIAIPGV